jgi:ferritin
MTDYMRKHMGHECPPRPEHPADQPKPPSDGTGCEDFPPTTPPTLNPPKPCPPPDSCCDCPDAPPSDSNCLLDLITQMQADTKVLQQETEFTTELNKLLDVAKKASQDYSRDKYKELFDKWVQEDIDLAELVRKLVCAVPCWRCIIDCFICPWLNKLRDATKWLYDDGKLITTVNDLYDLRYWLTRDRDYKNQRLQRIKAVLKAWETPSTTIEQTLNNNKTLMEQVSQLIGPHPGRAIYDVFLVLIPRHLAIAPPATDLDHTTRIDKKYTEFCPCDEGTPDNCCGPDVGYLTFRERLVGPLPYLIDPNKYFDLICCLVKKRYTPAKDAVSKADSELTKINGQIDGYEKALGETWKADFEKTVRAAIPSDIDCCDYEKHGDDKPRQSY